MLEERFIPDEVNEENQHIIHYIRHVSNTAMQDGESLARIRERLLHASAGIVPVPRGTVVGEAPGISSSPLKERATARSVHPAPSSQKAWSRRVSLLVAAVLVALMVGSLATLTARRGPTQGSIPSSWSNVVAFSGTGSTTIRGKPIHFPRLWGYTLTCTGEEGGILLIQMTGASNNWSLTSGCPTHSQAVPEAISFDLTARTLQTLQVRQLTSSPMTWQFLIVGAVVQPTLKPGPQWVQSSGAGGSGSGGSGGILMPVTKPGGQQIRPRTWGVIIICFGSGTGHVRFTEHAVGTGKVVGDVQFPVCNGQPTLSVVHLPAGENAQFTDISSNTGIIWQVQLMECIDEQRC